MTVKLIVAQEAEKDIADAYAWYEDQRMGLGKDFLNCVDACIEAIRRTPEMYSIIYENYRRGLVRRFPYAILYEYEEKAVTIYGVFYESCNPNRWRQRFS